MKPPAPVTRTLLPCAIGKPSSGELTSLHQTGYPTNTTGVRKQSAALGGSLPDYTSRDVGSFPCAGHSPMTPAQGCGLPSPLPSLFLYARLHLTYSIMLTFNSASELW